MFWLGIGQDAATGAAAVNAAAQTVNVGPAAMNVWTAATSIDTSFQSIRADAASVAPAIRAANPEVSTAAQAMAARVNSPIDALNLFHSGSHLVGEFARGITSNADAAHTAAVRVARRASGPLEFSTPPPGPLHDIGSWGPHMIDRWVDPMLRHGMRRVPAAARRLAEWMAEADQPRSSDWSDTPAPISRVSRARRRRWDDTANPDLDTDSTGDQITINVTVEGNVYGSGGTKQLAADLEKHLRRTQRGGRRLVGAY